MSQLATNRVRAWRREQRRKLAKGCAICLVIAVFIAAFFACMVWARC